MQKLIQKLTSILNSKLLPVFVILLEFILLCYLCNKKEFLSDAQLYLKYSIQHPNSQEQNSQELDTWTNENLILSSVFNSSITPNEQKYSPPTSLESSVDTYVHTDKSTFYYSFMKYPYLNYFTKYVSKKVYSLNSFNKQKWIFFSFNVLCFILLELLIYFFVYYLTKNHILSTVTMLVIGLNAYTLSSILNSHPTFFPSMLVCLSYIFLNILLIDNIDHIKGSDLLNKKFFIKEIFIIILLITSPLITDTESSLILICTSLYVIVYLLFKHKPLFLLYTLFFFIGILLTSYIDKDFTVSIINKCLSFPTGARFKHSISVLKFYLLDDYYTHVFVNISIVYVLFKLVQKFCFFSIDRVSKDINVEILRPSWKLFKVKVNFKFINRLVILGFSFLVCCVVYLGYNHPDHTFSINYILIATMFFIGLSCFIKYKSALVIYFLGFVFISILSLRTDQIIVYKKVHLPINEVPTKLYVYSPNLTNNILQSDLLELIKFMPKDASVFLSTTAGSIYKEIVKEFHPNQNVYLLANSESSYYQLITELKETTLLKFNKRYNLDQDFVIYQISDIDINKQLVRKK